MLDALIEAADVAYDYIYGPGDTPVEQINLGTSTPTYLTYTPSDDSWLTTNTAGDQTGYWQYDAYGTLAYGTPTTPFGYSGQYTDTTTGLVNDRARYYQPQTGGFTTRDPDYAGTDTAYTYASGDPISGADPTGQFGCGILSVVCDTAEQDVGDAFNGLEQGFSDVGPELSAGAEDVLPFFLLDPPNPQQSPPDLHDGGDNRGSIQVQGPDIKQNWRNGEGTLSETWNSSSPPWVSQGYMMELQLRKLLTKSQLNRRQGAFQKLETQFERCAAAGGCAAYPLGHNYSFAGIGSGVRVDLVIDSGIAFVPDPYIVNEAGYSSLKCGGSSGV